MSLATRSALPLTASGLALQNLTRLLDKKESTISEIEAVLGALIGVHSD